MSAPLIEDDVSIDHVASGGEQFRNCSHNAGVGEIAFAIVVLANDPDAGVVSRRFENEVMHGFEIAIVHRDNDALLTDRMLPVDRIVAA